MRSINKNQLSFLDKDYSINYAGTKGSAELEAELAENLAAIKPPELSPEVVKAMEVAKRLELNRL
jgi:hypothetical protein